ncbi:MAG: SagB/ThcOx family dehydrogenase [Aigarchaeota archaeon]|nr:SagB/ThcOx family dehydrogenase [Aigarchaeota archaeon]MDW8092298.1 SagB/ThcOx family dehydrogenase [Nitrososphaerota archaeon]
MRGEESYALTYHESTKHSYISIRSSGHRLDWSNKPYPFKVYLDGERVHLPKELRLPKSSALRSITGRSEVMERLDVSSLSGLLFFSYGITRVREYFGERFYFRAAPCTGALYQSELYVVSHNVVGLEQGVYHFDPGEFVLTVLRRGDFRWWMREATLDDSVKGCGASVILTSVPWRNAWKYGERSYRHSFWDGGVILANMISVANALGIESKIFVGFVDKRVNDLLGIGGMEESAIAVLDMKVNGGAATVPRAIEQLDSLDLPRLPYSPRELSYPAIVKAFETSALQSAEALREWRARVAEYARSKITDDRLVDMRVEIPSENDRPLHEVILQRGSTRRFSRRPIKRGDLETILRCSSSSLNSDFTIKPTLSLLDIYLIVNEVDGLEEGAYFYDRVRDSLVGLKRGRFRTVSRHLCLEQDLGGDASAVLFFMADVREVVKMLGERGYRACQLEAGVRAGRTYLAAYALGLGATGLTFYDDDVREFFSPHAADKENMMTVAIGVPAYRSQRGEIYLGIVEHPRAHP